MDVFLGKVRRAQFPISLSSTFYLFLSKYQLVSPKILNMLFVSAWKNEFQNSVTNKAIRPSFIVQFFSKVWVQSHFLPPLPLLLPFLFPSSLLLPPPSPSNLLLPPSCMCAYLMCK